jgi:hypothetical protein
MSLSNLDNPSLEFDGNLHDGTPPAAEPNNEGKDSAEMQDKAEQLDALSQVRNPIKDASPVIEAHTRRLRCEVSDCSSTFRSKNERERHIVTLHQCASFYRCSDCSESTTKGKVNKFNRKDLFTDHLRRMHCPFNYKSEWLEVDRKTQSKWNAYVMKMQLTCLVRDSITVALPIESGGDPGDSGDVRVDVGCDTQGA